MLVMAAYEVVWGISAVGWEALAAWISDFLVFMNLKSPPSLTASHGNLHAYIRISSKLKLRIVEDDFTSNLISQHIVVVKLILLDQQRQVLEQDWGQHMDLAGKQALWWLPSNHGVFGKGADKERIPAI